MNKIFTVFSGFAVYDSFQKITGVFPDIDIRRSESSCSDFVSIFEQKGLRSYTKWCFTCQRENRSVKLESWLIQARISLEKVAQSDINMWMCHDIKNSLKCPESCHLTKDKFLKGEFNQYYIKEKKTDLPNSISKHCKMDGIPSRLNTGPSQIRQGQISNSTSCSQRYCSLCKIPVL